MKGKCAGDDEAKELRRTHTSLSMNVHNGVTVGDKVVDIVDVPGHRRLRGHVKEMLVKA